MLCVNLIHGDPCNGHQARGSLADLLSLITILKKWKWQAGVFPWDVSTVFEMNLPPVEPASLTHAQTLLKL